MKYIKRIEDKTPIIFDVMGVNDKYIELPPYNDRYWLNISELYNNVYFADPEKRIIFHTRDINFLQLPGLLLIRHSKIPLVIVYKSKKELEAVINKDYANVHPSHKTILNQFAKKNGVRPKNIQYIPLQEILNTFDKTVKVSMEDYDENYQLEISNKFLNYINTEGVLINE